MGHGCVKARRPISPTLLQEKPLLVSLLGAAGRRTQLFLRQRLRLLRPRHAGLAAALAHRRRILLHLRGVGAASKVLLAGPRDRGSRLHRATRLKQVVPQRLLRQRLVVLRRRVELVPRVPHQEAGQHQVVAEENDGVADVGDVGRADEASRDEAGADEHDAATPRVPVGDVGRTRRVDADAVHGAVQDRDWVGALVGNAQPALDDAKQQVRPGAVAEHDRDAVRRGPLVREGTGAFAVADVVNRLHTVPRGLEHRANLALEPRPVDGGIERRAQHVLLRRRSRLPLLAFSLCRCRGRGRGHLLPPLRVELRKRLAVSLFLQVLVVLPRRLRVRPPLHEVVRRALHAPAAEDLLRLPVGQRLILPRAAERRGSVLRKVSAGEVVVFFFSVVAGGHDGRRRRCLRRLRLRLLFDALEVCLHVAF
eukprot:Rhum_TRINITY_DN2028_c0_g1::Rhum_TRINITY_DN2028_c0_g1_i1::g.5537::m.5537